MPPLLSFLYHLSHFQKLLPRIQPWTNILKSKAKTITCQLCKSSTRSLPSRLMTIWTSPFTNHMQASLQSQNSCHKMRKKRKQKDTIPFFLSSQLSIDKSHWHCQKSNQYISWVTPCSIILSPYIQTLSQWPWIWNNGKTKKHPHHSLNSCPTENHHLWHPKSTVEPFLNKHKQTNKQTNTTSPSPLSLFLPSLPKYVAKCPTNTFNALLHNPGQGFWPHSQDFNIFKWFHNMLCAIIKRICSCSYPIFPLQQECLCYII